MFYTNPILIISGATALGASLTERVQTEGAPLIPVAPELVIRRPVHRMGGYCYHLVWTGTPTGAFKLQVSSAYSSASNSYVRWEDLPGASASAAGSADGWLYNTTNPEYDQVRLVYTRSSGTGSLDVYFQSRGRD